MVDIRRFFPRRCKNENSRRCFRRCSLFPTFFQVKILLVLFLLFLIKNHSSWTVEARKKGTDIFIFQIISENENNLIINWNHKSEEGRQVGSGVYIIDYQLEAKVLDVRNAKEDRFLVGVKRD